MAKEARTGVEAPRRRTAPSLGRTRQALRKVRGRASRVPLEMRIIAIRNSNRLA